MHLKYRNVNEAFTSLVTYLDSEIKMGGSFTEVADSRVGKVIKFTEPVIITYTNPKERVLLNAARDCNPFFHLYESLWMLAGRNDVASLQYYSSKIGNIASDNGETFNGAYGYRWRHADTSVEERDQLPILVEHLQNNPNSRRAVLQMWNVEDDLLNIDEGLDVCCNLSVCFKLRNETKLVHCFGDPERKVTYLDMTVFNRSNDLIWGMLGANVVHFSFLQEYMAGKLRVEVGEYNQISNDLHVYTETNSGFKPDEWLADTLYTSQDRKTYRIIDLDSSSEGFEDELKRIVDFFPFSEGKLPIVTNKFLDYVALPALAAFRHYKRKEWNSALDCVEGIQDTHWALACKEWLKKRKGKVDAKASAD